MVVLAKPNDLEGIRIVLVMRYDITTTTDHTWALAQYPFMADPGFIQAIVEFIEVQAKPEHRSLFEQRLAWLKQSAQS